MNRQQAARKKKVYPNGTLGFAPTKSLRMRNEFDSNLKECGSNANYQRIEGSSAPNIRG